MDDSIVDLTRAGMRLEGLSMYGVVAALLMNVSLHLLSSTPRVLDHRRDENAVKIAFLLSVGTSIILGAHTAIVFSLLEVYSKTALGMGKDEQFVTFMDATVDIRESAFHAFLIALMAFMVSFILSLYLSLDERLRWWLTIVAGVAVAASMQHMSRIMLLSSEICLPKERLTRIAYLFEGSQAIVTGKQDRSKVVILCC